MGLIYDENSVRTGSNIRVHELDGTKHYLKHYGYKLELTFFAKHGTRQERWQAEKELTICERKLSYWEKHPRFVGEDARRGMETLNKQWRG